MAQKLLDWFKVHPKTKILPKLFLSSAQQLVLIQLWWCSHGSLHLWRMFHRSGLRNSWRCWWPETILPMQRHSEDKLVQHELYFICMTSPWHSESWGCCRAGFCRQADNLHGCSFDLLWIPPSMCWYQWVSECKQGCAMKWEIQPVTSPPRHVAERSHFYFFSKSRSHLKVRMNLGEKKEQFNPFSC